MVSAFQVCGVEGKVIECAIRGVMPLLGIRLINPNQVGDMDRN